MAFFCLKGAGIMCFFLLTTNKKRRTLIHSMTSKHPSNVNSVTSARGTIEVGDDPIKLRGSWENPWRTQDCEDKSDSGWAYTP